MSSSQSVIMTLEDIEVDPSLLLEKTLQFIDKEINEIDTKIYELITPEESQNVELLQLKDYLQTVY